MVTGMIEFWNVVIGLIVGLIGGAAVHSAWLHSRKRGELGARMNAEKVCIIISDHNGCFCSPTPPYCHLVNEIVELT